MSSARNSVELLGDLLVRIREEGVVAASDTAMRLDRYLDAAGFVIVPKVVPLDLYDKLVKRWPVLEGGYGIVQELWDEMIAAAKGPP